MQVLLKDEEIKKILAKHISTSMNISTSRVKLVVSMEGRKVCATAEIMDVADVPKATLRGNIADRL